MAESKDEKRCNLCGKPMGIESGDNHRCCEDYEACLAERA